MNISLNNFGQQLVFTIILVLIWRLLRFIPVPGINRNYFIGDFIFKKSNIFQISIFRRFSLVSLDILPYLDAYLTVEFLSLFLPPLKSWRMEGHLGRINLKKAAYILTLFISLIQGYVIAIMLETMKSSTAIPIIPNPGVTFRLIYTISITIGTFLSILIANMITDNGVGHGISILLLSGYLLDLFISGVDNVLNITRFDLFLITVAILVAFIVLMEKTHFKAPVVLDEGIKVDIPFKLITAGIIPLTFGPGLLIFPMIFLQFLNQENRQIIKWLINIFTTGKIGYNIACFFIIIIMHYIFTALFYNPEKIIELLNNRGASIIVPQGTIQKNYIDKNLESMAFISTMYLYFFAIIPVIIYKFFGFYLNTICLITSVAIFLDLIEEMYMRIRSRDLIKIAELHDIPMVGFIKNFLKNQGIPCCLRGYYHRALLYFFGPYIDVSVLVPESRADEAIKLIKKYKFGD